MKAILCTKYGSPDVLQLQEAVKPAPQDDEVLIKIQAASVGVDTRHPLVGLFVVVLSDPSVVRTVLSDATWAREQTYTGGF